MVSASLETAGKTGQPYGENFQGMLVFNADMHFVEVLTDGGTPRFESNARSGGADDENRRACSGLPVSS